MLTRHGSRRRRGLTLIELTISLTLLGLVLALVAQIATALQRQLARASDRGAALEQLRDAAAILPLDLRAVSSAGGEIASGGATDSSLETQLTLASGVLCAVDGTHALLAIGTRADGSTRPGIPAPGDTLWFLADRDSVERWVPLAAQAVQSTSLVCPIAHGPGTGAVLDTLRTLSVDLGIALGDSTRARTSGLDSAIASIDAGAPVRITRPTRYRVYRGGDGAWYLGVEEWNAALARFQGVQPVSGPFGAARTGSGGAIRFRYYDSTGAAIAPGTAETHSIARIEVMLHSSSRHTAPAGPFDVSDSLRATIALRNRRP